MRACGTGNHPNGAAVRVITRDGEPWFVAADVCAALTVGNTAMAMARLDDDEKGVSSIDTPGGQQRLAIVNESGLYSLILGSRKPEAKRFKKWVTAEVLPSIRKTGVYSVTAARPQPTIPKSLSEALRLAADHAEVKERAEANAAVRSPAAAACAWADQFEAAGLSIGRATG